MSETVWIPTINESAGRRVRALRITPELVFGTIRAFCEGPRTFSASGLPADARFVRAYMDNHRFIVLEIESETFAVVHPGNEPPQAETVCFTEHFPESPHVKKAQG
jgi:hypothetical protein